MNKTLHIVQLEIENVKRLTAVRIDPSTGVNRIEGRNAQGKSSVLDAIEWGLAGAKAAPAETVRRGAKKATVRMYLDGGIVLERTTTVGGSAALKVMIDGQDQKSPQAVLDKLYSKLIDPLAFTRLTPAQQRDTLAQLAGLDFTNLDNERAALYSQRTTLNRDLGRLEAQMGPPLSLPADLPKEQVSLADIADKHRQAVEHNAERENRVRALAEQERKVKEWEEKITNAQRQLTEMRHWCATEAQSLASVPALVTSTTAAAIEQAERTNNLIRAKREREAQQAEADRLRAEAEARTIRIEAIDRQKADLVANAKYPLKGLSIDDTGVRLNGNPFAQASSAEQLRAAVAIGLAQNPTLKVMLVRDGSLLDEASLANLAAICEEAGAQVFLERVAEHAGPGAILIEDGEAYTPAAQRETAPPNSACAVRG